MSSRILAQTIGFTDAAFVPIDEDMDNNRSLMSLLKTLALGMPRTIISEDLALTAGDQVDVFTVNDGYVLLLGMTLVITAAVSANAALVGFVFDPVAAYGASATDIATETGSADLQSAAIGDMFAADLDATAVVKYANGTALAPYGAVNPGGLVLSPGGGIDVTISTSNPTTGTGDVIVTYLPLSVGAYLS